jgi:hypothetical protein
VTTRNPREERSIRTDASDADSLGPEPSDRPVTIPALPMMRFSADSVADAALQQRVAASDGMTAFCDACDAPLEGEPEGRGLFMWTRGEEQRFEEPGLCRRCATAIGVTALAAWGVEEEEG